jgi:hypothetical protein
VYHEGVGTWLAIRRSHVDENVLGNELHTRCAAIASAAHTDDGVEFSASA